MVITSFFTQSSIPALGLAPILNIWEVQSGSQTLVINGDSMIEVGDGFYKYDFTIFDLTKSYVIRSDGGNTLDDDERYSVGVTDDSNLDPTVINNIVNHVWDETGVSHTSIGSFGLIVQQIKADTTQLRLDTLSIISLVTTLLKYEKNRTKVDKLAKTLTVYDDDGITPIRIFDLYDSNNIPSTAEIADKVPQ